MTNVTRRLRRASQLHLRVFWSCCRDVFGHKSGPGIERCRNMNNRACRVALHRTARAKSCEPTRYVHALGATTLVRNAVSCRLPSSATTTGTRSPLVFPLNQSTHGISSAHGEPPNQRPFVSPPSCSYVPRKGYRSLNVLHSAVSGCRFRKLYSNKPGCAYHFMRPWNN